MMPFGSDPLPDWVPRIRLDVPSGWQPVSGHLQHDFAQAGFDTAPHPDGLTGAPQCVEGRVEGTPVRAALLTSANRRIAELTNEQIVADLECTVPEPRVVVPIDLPIGRSLRLRTRIRVAPEAPEQAVVQYVTSPIGECRLVLTLLTGSLAYEREFVETFDQIAISMALA